MAMDQNQSTPWLSNPMPLRRSFWPISSYFHMWNRLANSQVCLQTNIPYVHTHHTVDILFTQKKQSCTGKRHSTQNWSTNILSWYTSPHQKHKQKRNKTWHTHTNNMEQPKKHKSRIAKIESVFSYMLSPAQTYKRQSDPKAHGLLSSGDSGSLSRKHMKVIESVYQTVTHTHSHIHKAFYIGSQHRNGMQSRGWSRCTWT
jgi:hypothetical protein